MPTFDNIEEYLASVEEYFHSSFTAVTHSLPDMHEVVNQLWIDISRYGPGMPGFPEMHIPTLGDFQIPPPPPPPPPVNSSWIEKSAEWAGNHPWKASGIFVGVVGTGLLVNYRHAFFRPQPQKHYVTSKKPQATERRQIVVVLGGDTPYGLPLILDLEKKGYIVIASVCTPEAVDALESKCAGYVKAHVLDPYELASVPIFLRSLSLSLSRKFPINVAGDPYASPSSLPYIHSIISLLTLAAPTLPPNAPLEHVALQSTYLPYLTATQVTPLAVIQSLLPLLRTVSARSIDKGKKSIIVCLPATDARVGLPFASVQAMSAAGTLKGADVLRREIRIASMTGQSDSMQNVNVVVVDVGTFDIGSSSNYLPPEGIYKAMEHWTPSEKVVYGPAFIGVMGKKYPATSHLDRMKSNFKSQENYGLPRKATDLSVFADSLVRVVSGGCYGPSLFGLGLSLGRIQNWLRGERFSLGAGASTYKLASHLPSVVLDGLLSLPHFLISIRNRLLPVQPFRGLPTDLPPSVTSDHATSTAKPKLRQETVGTAADTEINSDADVESNAGDAVESSWISLNSRNPSDEA